MTEQDNAEGSAYVEIQPNQLSEEALRGLAEEFVTRSGTDYGSQERSFESKIQDVMRQLARGDVHIVYDAGTESVNLLTTHELKKYTQS
jgi:hypothetical protein